MGKVQTILKVQIKNQKFSRLYFSSDLRGGMNRFPIIEHNLQKVRGAAMEAAFQDAEKLENLFTNDSKENVIVKGSAIGEVLNFGRSLNT